MKAISWTIIALAAILIGIGCVFYFTRQKTYGGTFVRGEDYGYIYKAC